MQTVSVDIGSTWTKAALFARRRELTLVNHVLTPTTTHHLADGFCQPESGAERCRCAPVTEKR
jgi:sugar (pentulose or hexulose) kinase